MPSTAPVSRSRPARHLDPRQPLVLDTRELGRRPGSMHRVSLHVAAPGDLGIPLVQVPPGAEMALELRLEAVMEGVLVSGTVTAPVEAECARCLDPVRDTVTAPIQELFAYPDSATQETTAADEVRRLTGDRLDLEPALRDAVVLTLPLAPVCAPDCAGLCPTCGERLADFPTEHTHDEVDPRWAVLADLRGN